MKKPTSLRNNRSGCVSLLLLLLQIQISSHLVKSYSATTSVKPTTSESLKTINKTAKQPANERLNLIEADENGLYLVGLFDIHHSNPRIPFKCGQIDTDVGDWQSRRPMQNMEAFLWAIEQVNADKSLLPGVRLGSLVLDTCSSFLRTNQQMANLLHGHPSHPGPAMPQARQIAAIIADNYDWQSVEAVVSMASALDLTTFVTQSRSSKLSEFARKYKPNNQLELNQNLRPAFDEDESSMQRRMSQTAAHPLEGLLGELLGVGKMTSPSPISDNLTTGAGEDGNKLYMVKMPLSNELLAETLVALAQQMSWDLVSVIYDDEQDMVDLHDELARQLLSRRTQLAHSELLSVNSNQETYDRLLQSLGRKSTTLGSRVVITLLGSGSARLLLDSLKHLRSQAVNSGPGSEQYQLAQQVNSLLWVTVTDREPYYSFATDALGTIAVSSSVSLLPEFKSYYDQLAVESHSAKNRWWPEYLRAVLLKHQRDVELVANECARWQEPRQSPAQDKCRSLTLTSLIQYANDNKRWLPTTTTTTATGSHQKTTAIGKAASQAAAISGGKLSKYLAGGWEHNGMDVINSVLAAANGLEAIRQSLCPGQRVGLCNQMRELISPTLTNTNNQAPAGVVQQIQPQVPTVSELMYNELLRSTFQLADGRMFNLDDFSSQGGQVEGKFKLYNLRYLQQNSIGFVKFGSYDQLDGLELNTTKARYYPSPMPSFRDQEPIEKVKSTCQDESKCLMFDTLVSGVAQQQQHQQQQQASAAATNKQTISEEELAAGMNSLFKLDHPMLIPASDQTTVDQKAASQARQEQPQLVSDQLLQAVSSNQRSTSTARQVIEDSLQVHTMRSAPSLNAHFGFNWSMAEHSGADQQQQQQVNQPTTTMRFNTIVLLPLHNSRTNNKGYQSSRSSSSVKTAECSVESELDTEHSFQHLVALGYAQQVVNGLLRGDGVSFGESDAALGKNNDNGSIGNNNANNNNRRSSPSGKQQIELTTTVIDYCDRLDLAKSKLAALLSATAPSQHQSELTIQSSSSSSSFVGKPVAVIDFDEEISENIDSLVSNNANLLHLTIATKRRHLPPAGDKQLIGSQMVASSQAATSQQENRFVKPLRVNLLPSKTNEIQAIVKLISSMSQWRLVHLIYTDHHHYRDEFVRRANEANICVSKLIWIPTIGSSLPSHQHQQQHHSDDSGTGSSANGKTTTIEQQMIQLEKTRRLFAQELFDFSKPESPLSFASKAAAGAQQISGNSGAQGLNSTKLLVVLASENDATNQMILEAASDSMLDDYIWVTSHEWLASVELPAEMAQNQELTISRQVPTEPRLPRYFLSTRLETHESRRFKHYLSSLTPALHSPLPTRWFDEFWQQHFQCQLPFASAKAGSTNGKVCKPGQSIDLSRMAEDDRVHYVVHALESVGEALQQQQHRETPGSFSPQEFATNFRRTFEKHTGAGGYGFHIVHRLLTARGSAASSARRENSRDLGQVQSAGQLVRVGLWRLGELIMLNQKRNDNITGNWWLSKDETDSSASDLDTTTKVVRSINKLASIKSRCSATQTCALCRQQIERTMAFIKQEEARLGLSESVLEPKAISWNYPTAANRQKLSNLKPAHQSNTSILDLVPNNVFGGDDLEESSDDSGDDGNQAVTTSDGELNSDGGKSGHGSGGGGGNAKASRQVASLFDAATSSQLERQRETDLRRVAGQMSKMQAGAGVASIGLQPPTNLLNLRQLPGLLMSLLSLLGVVCMVASITYFYPNMLERKSYYLYTSGGCDGGNSSGERQRHSSAAIIQQANINDYFLLTGLLMLYSINVAFLLPATMSVCWFRRIGLATSYTVIFSSILVKVLSCLRQHCRNSNTINSNSAKNHLTGFRSSIRHLLSMRYDSNGNKQQLNSNFSGCRSLSANQADGADTNSSQKTTLPVNGQSAHSQRVVDPLELDEEESVEVTFESLPHYHDVGALKVDEQQKHQQTVAVDSSTIGHHSTSSGSSERYTVNQQQVAMIRRPSSEVDESRRAMLNGGSNLLTISVCLIISQILVSLVWFIQQPPEPTLYFACWRCSSPTRSPLLFLYEPLISLLYPALLLVITWALAIRAFKNASLDEEECRAAAKRLLLATGSPVNSPRDCQLRAKQRMMDYKLRDAKSLVMTTTLIVLTWSLSTLNMISTNRKLLLSSASMTSNGNIYQQQPAIYSLNQNESVTRQDDLTLVYANIFSGAIIFAFLFIYRLHLFNFTSSLSSSNSCFFSCSLLSLGSKSKNRPNFTSTSTNGFNNVSVNNNSSIIGSLLKFNQPSSSSSADGTSTNFQHLRSKWLGNDLQDLQVSANETSTSSSLFGSLSGQMRGQERLRLQQFSSYGATHSSSSVASAADPLGTYHTSTTINPLHSESFVETIGGGSFGRQSGASSTKKNRLNFFNSNESRSKLKGKKSRQKAASSLFFGSSGSALNSTAKNKPPVPKLRTNNAQNNTDNSGGLSSAAATNRNDKEFKLYRCRSTNSTASSTAKLVGGGGGSDTSSIADNDIFMDDTISCASSVASSSTSQLQGNELYPIDCSIQLDSQMPNSTGGLLRRSASFNRRSSIRKSVSKLSSVTEERSTLATCDIATTQNLET